MEWCPHCQMPYDDDNDTQPCCGGCGHPYTCSCWQRTFSTSQAGLRQYKPRYKYYAVVSGGVPGIYDYWVGPYGAERQVNGYSGARYKGVYSLDEAKEWYRLFAEGKEPDLRFEHG